MSTASAAALLALPWRMTTETARRGPDALLQAIHDAVPPHVVVQGGSGHGKTTLLERLLVDSLDQGAAIAVICPHGDLAARAAAHLEARGEPATVLDLGAESAAGTWNLAVPPDGIDPEDHVALVYDLLHDMWRDMPNAYLGPVFQRCIRTALRMLIVDPQGPWPLTHLPRLFEPESTFRDDIVARLKPTHPEVARFVDSELVPSLRGDSTDLSLSMYVNAKLSPLLDDAAVRRVVAGGRSHQAFAGVREGRSLVMAMPVARMSDVAVGLFGGLAVGLLWRVARSGSLARPVHVYVDEWHRFPLPDLGAILAEGRKMGISLRLAHQYLTQIPVHLRHAALGNVGAIVGFRSGPADAALLAPFCEGLGTDTLVRLPKFTAAVSTGDDAFVAAAPEPLDHGDAVAAFVRLHDATVEALPPDVRDEEEEEEARERAWEETALEAVLKLRRLRRERAAKRDDAPSTPQADVDALRRPPSPPVPPPASMAGTDDEPLDAAQMELLVAEADVEIDLDEIAAMMADEEEDGESPPWRAYPNGDEWWEEPDGWDDDWPPPDA